MSSPQEKDHTDTSPPPAAAASPPPPPDSTPATKPESNNTPAPPLSRTSYITFPVTHVVSGLYRRLTEPTPARPSHDPDTDPMSLSGVFTPPRRTASPFQPPPLTPLSLKATPDTSGRLLTRALAEEIRLLVPPRLQLVDTWQLVYSLERDGSSLSTLYDKSREYSSRSQRAGYVLVVRGASASGAGSGTGNNGSLFGAYLTDPPRPTSHYYGTGECFLWRASTLPSTPLIQVGTAQGNGTPAGSDTLGLPGLPPPPSADTSNLMGRSTTFKGASRSGTSTPDRIRFKAFPYSGVNDYMIFCETGFLSVGGGDGHFGLWLDNSLEQGVSAPCPTFGNEPLSDEGTKFDVLGVELWYVGS